MKKRGNFMKRAILFLLPLCLLCIVCILVFHDAEPAPSTPTTGPDAKAGCPTELESDFVVLCDRMEDSHYMPTPSLSGAFYLITKEPVTEDDVRIKTGDISWQFELTEEERYAIDNPINWAYFYAAFRAYQDVDWAELYTLIIRDLEAYDSAYRQYAQLCDEKGTAWYPEFYCYDVRIRNPDCGTMAVEGSHTETDLTVTVKGNTQVLEDVCSFTIYEDSTGWPNPNEDPMFITQLGIDFKTTFPTDEGYFYFDGYSQLTARKNLTITGASFHRNTTASFLEMELVVDGIRMAWDGKTPVEVAAGETVQLRFIAQDPTLGHMLCGSFTRNAQLEYTCEEESYTCPIWQKYRIALDAYQCYAVANGRKEQVYSYYVDYQTKASGWQPGYVLFSYTGTGATGNPFLDD